MSNNVTHYDQHTGVRQDKFFKTTLFRADQLMIGLNCLEPGQVQPVHSHHDQAKFYFVIEGVGSFTVGNEVIEAGPGHIVWSEAGVPHGVENNHTDRLVIFMGIAPAP